MHHYNHLDMVFRPRPDTLDLEDGSTYGAWAKNLGHATSLETGPHDCEWLCPYLSPGRDLATLTVNPHLGLYRLQDLEGHLADNMIFAWSCKPKEW